MNSNSYTNYITHIPRYVAAFRVRKVPLWARLLGVRVGDIVTAELANGIVLHPVIGNISLGPSYLTFEDYQKVTS